jgi:hypothetical protein
MPFKASIHWSRWEFARHTYIQQCKAGGQTSRLTCSALLASNSSSVSPVEETTARVVLPNKTLRVDQESRHKTFYEIEPPDVIKFDISHFLWVIEAFPLETTQRGESVRRASDRARQRSRKTPPLHGLSEINQLQLQLFGLFTEERLGGPRELAPWGCKCESKRARRGHRLRCCTCDGQRKSIAEDKLIRNWRVALPYELDGLARKAPNQRRQHPEPRPCPMPSFTGLHTSTCRPNEVDNCRHIRDHTATAQYWK